ncbi:hypothetical protein [Synechococcus sp. CBW1107]|uniref:hypothetical protein n=1 Tax=Synechococcus sp. CBW1107 TaxID=2789857 RepID=UPI001E479BBF|nr:hypothetical protein [Synechococcus sp. CBW1107]
MFYIHEPLKAFSITERSLVSPLLIRKISSLGGIDKLEEEHWTSIYCEIKNIPFQSFSNVFGNDIELSDGSVVEMKCIRVGSLEDKKWIMHPSLTRVVPEWSTSDSAQDNMFMIVNAYNDLISKTFRGKPARWGILLYLGDFSSFMYFEYPIKQLDPSRLVARYRSVERIKVSRRSTTNLWVYDGGNKIMSITSPKAGMKIQPYFYVPAQHPERYVFDLRSQPVPIEKSIQRLIAMKAEKDSCSHDQVIASILNQQHSDSSEEFVAEPSVTFEVVQKLGGIGSDWKTSLIRRLTE